MHQSRYCNGIEGYVPKQLRPGNSSVLDNFFLKDRLSNSLISSRNEMISNSNEEMASINMPIFDEQEDAGIVAASDFEEGVMNSSNMFQIHQESFCRSVFGEQYLACKNMQEIKEVLRLHASNQTEKKKRNQAIYSFVSEKGLSREDGNDLLRLLRSFRPQHFVPKSFQAIEKSARVDVATLFDYRVIEVPWIDSWQMHKLPGYPPVKIYCRSLFQIISQMLIDPEIMIVWKKHVYMNYWRAVDKDGQHVYSDVMTSTWCEESEKLVHDKDPDGHLMPLILYTDGVQVSTHARNKITPVMVTLGNFSDELLQKDCSKRVIAYLPNFKGNSKDNIKAHLIKTLSISKTAVRYHIFMYFTNVIS